MQRANIYLSNPIKTVMCICGKNNIPSESEIKLCTTCHTYQHLKCIKRLANIVRFYECPTCQFKNLDPGIEIVDTLVSPTIISCDDLINGQYKRTIKFLYRTESGKRYKEMINQGKNIFIAIRCLRLDDYGYEHHWPFNCKMILNRKNIMELKLQKFPILSRPREDWPLIIHFDNTKFNEKSKHINLQHLLNENSLDFEINYKENDSDEYNYAIAIDVIRVLAKSTIITRTENLKDKDRLINLLSDNINSGHNILASEKVSLLDLFSGNSMISLPARGLTCQHASVFDLDSYLTLNSKCKKWNCPICMKKATRLYIDSILTEFMEKNQDAKEVIFNFTDFSYSLAKETDISKEKKNELEIIDLENEDQYLTLNKYNKNKEDASKNLNLKVEKASEKINLIDKVAIPSFLDLNDLPYNQGYKKSNNNQKESEKKKSDKDLLIVNNNLQTPSKELRNIQSFSEANEIIPNPSISNSYTNPGKELYNFSLLCDEIIENNNNPSITPSKNKVNSNNSITIDNKTNKVAFNDFFSIFQGKKKFEDKILQNYNNQVLTIPKISKKEKIEIEGKISFSFPNSNLEKKHVEDIITRNYFIYYESLVEKGEELRKIRDLFLKRKRTAEDITQ